MIRKKHENRNSKFKNIKKKKINNQVNLRININYFMLAVQIIIRDESPFFFCIISLGIKSSLLSMFTLPQD